MVIEKLPTVQIPQFRSFSEIGTDRLSDYYRNCSYHICEYSVGVKQMWQAEFHYAFAEAAGCLLCRAEAKGNVWFDFPVPGENGDILAALEAIESYCMETETPLHFTTLSKDAVSLLSTRYDGLRIQKTNLWRDYLYSTEVISAFAGRQYAGQRNHIRKFERLFPGAIFRELLPEDAPLLQRFLERFESAFHKKGGEANFEREAAFSMLRCGNEGIFRMGCLEYAGEIIGVSLGEKCGDTLVIHIEKALAADFEGVYPMLFQSFVKTFGIDCKFVNREDDSADPGLRTSKMQYHPLVLEEKFDAEVESPLHFLDEVPSFSSERLLINEITESDENLYGKLCLDDENNRFWGYDYRKDLGDRAVSGADFVRMAKEDFSARLSLSLALRYQGQLIGEAVLYRFNYRGEAELGVRIIKNFQGQGFGKEAFRAVSDWALYSLGITCLRARCFKENAASKRMLESTMTLKNEDEKMVYFERKI